MSAVVNPRDLLLRGTPTRLVPIMLPANISIPALEVLQPDPAKPPPPTGLTVEAAIYDINIRTNPPAFLQGHGYSHTKVYGKVYAGGALPVFADAVLVTSFIGQVGSITVGPAVNARVWVTWVSKDGVESDPAGGLNGALGQTGEDAARLVAALTGPGKPFTIVNEQTVLTDGTVVPAGTYSSAAFMQRFVAQRGQIALLAVDDARISTLSATKLVSGTIQVGTHISSSNYVGGQQGWAINGSGGAEFNSVFVRGGIAATWGTIGGCTITGGGVYSPNFSEYAGWGFDINGNAQFNQIKIRGAIMGGSYDGYAWPANGGGGFYLGPGGLLLGNANVGRYVQITTEGNFYSPGFSIENGVMTINQANVIDTLNVRGEAINSPGFGAGQIAASIVRSLVAGQPVYIHGSVGAFNVNIPNEGAPIVPSSELYVNGSLLAASLPSVGAAQGVGGYAVCGSTTVMTVWLPPYTGTFTFGITGGGACVIYINQTKR